MKKIALAALVVGMMTGCAADNEPLTDNAGDVASMGDASEALEVIPDDLGRIKPTPDTTSVSVNYDAITIDGMVVEGEFFVPGSHELSAEQREITIEQTLDADNKEYSNDFMTLRLEGRTLQLITPKEEQRPSGYSFVITLSAGGSKATLRGFKRPYLIGIDDDMPENPIVPLSLTFPASGGTLTANIEYKWINFFDISVGDIRYDYSDMRKIFKELRMGGMHKFDWMTLQVSNCAPDRSILTITLDENPDAAPREFEISICFLETSRELHGTQAGQTSSLPEIRL